MMRLMTGREAYCTVLGLDSEFELESPEGYRRRFLVQKAKIDPNPNFRFIKVWREEVSEFSYLGILCRMYQGRWYVRRTQATGIRKQAQFDLIRGFIESNRHRPDNLSGYMVWHVGKCRHCRRPLTDPDSIMKGVGPECEKKGIDT